MAHVDDTRKLNSRIKALDIPQNKSHDCPVPLQRNTPLVPRCVTRGLSQGFLRLVAELLCCARAWHCTSSSSFSSSFSSSSSSAGWVRVWTGWWETDSVEDQTVTRNIDPSVSLQQYLSKRDAGNLCWPYPSTQPRVAQALIYSPG